MRSRLNGIFAFGLWDEPEQLLLLARDHLRVKPLFYTERDGAILFGSEPKVLLAHPGRKPRSTLTAWLSPDDVHRRKKSAYPNAQHPAYDEAIGDWACGILNDSNAPIQPLPDLPAARALVKSNAAGVPGVTLVSLSERIIQLNEWLKRYQVTLAL